MDFLEFCLHNTYVSLQVYVRKQNGSLINFVEPQNNTITLVREQFYADVDESTISETTHDLDENGHCFLSLDVAKNESSFSLKVNRMSNGHQIIHKIENLISFKAKYAKQETDLGIFYTTPNKVADKISLNAKVLTERYTFFHFIFVKARWIL